MKFYIFFIKLCTSDSRIIHLLAISQSIHIQNRVRLLRYYPKVFHLFLPFNFPVSLFYQLTAKPFISKTPLEPTLSLNLRSIPLFKPHFYPLKDFTHFLNLLQSQNLTLIAGFFKDDTKQSEI